jgi:DNA-binding MarR family transcriptional regulator
MATTARQLRPLDDRRLTAVGMVMEVHQGLLQKFGPTLSRHGLSGNEFEVMLRLGRTPGGRLRMSDLATQTTLTTSGVTRVVDRLERSGLVERTMCDADRRGTWAQITGQGTEKISAATEDHLADVEEWFSGRLADEQIATLTDILRIVRDAVRPGAVAGS